MIDRHQEIGSIADRLDFERLRGFCDGWTDRQTDICYSRVAFVTENLDININFLIEIRGKNESVELVWKILKHLSYSTISAT